MPKCNFNKVALLLSFIYYNYENTKSRDLHKTTLTRFNDDLCTCNSNLLQKMYAIISHLF